MEFNGNRLSYILYTLWLRQGQTYSLRRCTIIIMYPDEPFDYRQTGCA